VFHFIRPGLDTPHGERMDVGAFDPRGVDVRDRREAEESPVAAALAHLDDPDSRNMLPVLTWGSAESGLGLRRDM
jgi:hypothetical protein